MSSREPGGLPGDDLDARLRDLGARVGRTPAGAEELGMVRRGIRRRRRARGAAAGTAGTLVAVAAAVAVTVSTGGGGGPHIVVPATPTPTTTTSSPRPSSSSTPSSSAPTSVAPTGASSTPSSPPTTTAASSDGLPAASTPDVFARTTSAGVLVVSAQTGATLRTVVPESDAPRTAVVGPGGRFVYFVDRSGPARVPLTGGTVQHLPTPTGTVIAVTADRTDTELVETVGTIDQPRAFALHADGTHVVALAAGTGIGFSPDARYAYVRTVTPVTASTPTQVGSSAVAIVGYLVSNPADQPQDEATPHPVSSLPGNDGACGGPSTATAVSPTGEVAWALGGCTSKAEGRLSFAFRDVEAHTSFARITLPVADAGYFADDLQYTPAGTAVMTLTHASCTSNGPVWIERGNGRTSGNLTGAGPHC